MATGKKDSVVFARLIAYEITKHSNDKAEKKRESRRVSLSALACEADS